MPYELLSKASPVVAVVIFLGFLLKTFTDQIKSTNKQAQLSGEQLAADYKQLVNDVMSQSRINEERLHKQNESLNECLKNYNDSLREITECIRVIPVMQKDIEELKKESKEG